MTFASASAEVPALRGNCLPGLQALKAQDRRHVTKERKTRLTVGVDIDFALAPAQPNAARWDYGIGYRQGDDELVHWVEVHPASGRSNLTEMAKKLTWLQAWLRDSGLGKFQKRIVWVASGVASYNARHPAIKALAAKGLHFAGGHVRL